MRSSRSPVLALVAALVAVAALAGPVSASASVWLHNGEPLNERLELPLTGGELIEVGTAAFLCHAAATLTTEGGSTAEIAAYDVEIGSCVGLGGQFEGCEVTSAAARNLPWEVTVNSVDLTAREASVAYSFGEACPIHELETDFPELTLTPEEPAAIRLFHYRQKGTGEVDGEEAALTDGGALEPPEADFGTYGIG